MKTVFHLDGGNVTFDDNPAKPAAQAGNRDGINAPPVETLTTAKPTLEAKRKALELLKLEIEADEAAEHKRSEKTQADERTRKGQEARRMFQELEPSMREELKRFLGHHREACLSLGRLANAAAALTAAYNSIVAAQGGLPASELLMQLRELAVCPSALQALLDEGYKGKIGVGYDWNCPVVPVIRNTEQDL